MVQSDYKTTWQAVCIMQKNSIGMVNVSDAQRMQTRFGSYINTIYIYTSFITRASSLCINILIMTHEGSLYSVETITNI